MSTPTTAKMALPPSTDSKVLILEQAKGLSGSVRGGGSVSYTRRLASATQSMALR